MKKPVKRAIRLEEVLGDLIGPEETLLRLELGERFSMRRRKNGCGSVKKFLQSYVNWSKTYQTTLHKNTAPPEGSPQHTHYPTLSRGQSREATQLC